MTFNKNILVSSGRSKKTKETTKTNNKLIPLVYIDVNHFSEMQDETEESRLLSPVALFWDYGT